VAPSPSRIVSLSSMMRTRAISASLRLSQNVRQDLNPEIQIAP
jgi:hypothetical protein